MMYSLIFISIFFWEEISNDVEVNSNAAAAIKYNPGGNSQTYISTNSNAKTNADQYIYNIKDNQLNNNNNIKDAKDESEHIIIKKPVSTMNQHENENIPIDSPQFYDTNHYIARVDSPKTDTVSFSSFTTKESVKKNTWAYSESLISYSPNEWGEIWPKCMSKYQSPIAIDSGIANTTVSNLVSHLEWINMDTFDYVDVKLRNDGHGIGFEVLPNRTTKLRVGIKGGPLNDEEYYLHDIHFHFGCKDEPSSEHVIDGIRTFGEIHLSFRENSKFANLYDETAKITMLAILFKLKKNSINKVFKTMNTLMNYTILPNSSVELFKGIGLYKLLPIIVNGISNLPYFTYRGSLTTPPCYQTVTWIIFNDLIDVDHSDLSNWQSIQSDSGFMCNNKRPLQNFNDRLLYYIQPSINQFT